jgi:hypothetical protein
VHSRIRSEHLRPARHGSLSPFLPLGAVVEIKGKKYVCEDRIGWKYQARFDVNCDKDKRCPFEMTGWTMVKLVLH